jgi:DNA polymerase (family 10)
MDKNQVAAVLNNIGMLLELKGENVFKVRAYYDAARKIESLEGDLEALVRGGRLSDIKGFGSALTSKITELVTTGSLEYYEKLRAEFPEGIMELFRLQGLGAKKISVLYRELNIHNIEQLREACENNRLIGIKGFGEKSQQKILESIRNLDRYTGKHYYFTAIQTAEQLAEYIGDSGKAIRCSIAGDLRRKIEIVEKIDIVACSKDKNGLMDFMAGLGVTAKTIDKGENGISVLLPGEFGGINASIRVTDEKEYPFVLHRFTGSREHIAQLDRMAEMQGIKINEHGMFKGDSLIACTDEKDIYAALGMQYIPPELREGMDEVYAALNSKIPSLVSKSDLKGIMHVHTVYSDGHNSIEDLVKACMGMGYSYLGIADHSRSAYYAGGLKPDDIKRQHEEVDRINAKYDGFKVLKGIESDILPDGSLDYDEEILAGFDFIIASIHSSFGMSEERMTERIIKAMRSGYVTILGHPMGRLLLMRDAYRVNIGEVISAAAQQGVLMEINSNPYRLDLDWRYMKQAKEAGCKFVICPDAHGINEIRGVIYGIDIARKGWLTADDIINTRSFDGFISRIRSRRA